MHSPLILGPLQQLMVMVVFFIGAMIVISPPLLAQNDTETGPTTNVLVPQDRLRLHSQPYTGYATLLEKDRDTLTVVIAAASRSGKNTVVIPLRTVSHIERYRRVPWPDRALRGAKWGAIAGASVGTLGIVLSERGPGDPPQAWWPFVGIAYFTLPTAVLFAVVPEYEWQSLSIPENRHVDLRPGASGLVVRLRW